MEISFLDTSELLILLHRFYLLHNKAAIFFNFDYKKATASRIHELVGVPWFMVCP